MTRPSRGSLTKFGGAGEQSHIENTPDKIIRTIALLDESIEPTRFRLVGFDHLFIVERTLTVKLIDEHGHITTRLPHHQHPRGFMQSCSLTVHELLEVDNR